ncbi:hypothetical protein [Thermococcus waiotapuensis]|uniref:Uncharacterized protein n=1 Tax=Thermococcus waiotapuensis TaxID=90909 RepID=A0AAE4NWX4_9EURY|nr:hypothetical protein [Thermococcus waiotapuensis]MDV3104831.1 hypothetical protein [Thermococcus waiotapuensis]
MKSFAGIDYGAGYLNQVSKVVRKVFKKAKIKLGKNAYVVSPFEEKGQPAFFIIVDGGTARALHDELLEAQGFFRVVNFPVLPCGEKPGGGTVAGAVDYGHTKTFLYVSALNVGDVWL